MTASVATREKNELWEKDEIVGKHGKKKGALRRLWESVKTAGRGGDGMKVCMGGGDLVMNS